MNEAIQVFDEDPASDPPVFGPRGRFAQGAGLPVITLGLCSGTSPSVRPPSRLGGERKGWWGGEGGAATEANREEWKQN